VKPGPRLPGRYGEANRPAALIALAALLLAGCATTQAPLKPEHGYPADWPPLIALSEGLPELNGIYANTGVAATKDGKLVPMSIAELLPRTAPRTDVSPEADPDCEDCVALRVMPPKYKVVSSARLRFTVQKGGNRPALDVDTVGHANATLYMLTSSGGSIGIGLGVSNVEIRLTCAEDRSLIAQVHNFSGMLLMLLIPIATENDYFWARFERIGDLSQSPAANTAPPADR
jgi:hypothetical protein